MSSGIPDQAANAAPIDDRLHFVTTIEVSQRSEFPRPEDPHEQLRHRAKFAAYLHDLNPNVDPDFASEIWGFLWTLTEVNIPPGWAVDDGGRAYPMSLRDAIFFIGRQAGEVGKAMSAILQDEREEAEAELRELSRSGKVNSSKREIHDEVRRAIFHRDRYRCLGCNSRASLCIDHVIPWSSGGNSHPDNLQTLCRRCNSGKGTKTIDYRVTNSEGTPDAK